MISNRILTEVSTDALHCITKLHALTLAVSHAPLAPQAPYVQAVGDVLMTVLMHMLHDATCYEGRQTKKKKEHRAEATKCFDVFTDKLIDLDPLTPQKRWDALVDLLEEYGDEGDRRAAAILRRMGQ